VRTARRSARAGSKAAQKTAGSFACIQLAFEDLTLSQDRSDAGSVPTDDPRIHALPDIHGHPKGEHRPYAEERPIPYSARMLFLWFFHACRRGSPRFMMISDHINYLTFEDPAAVNLVRRALKLAQAGDLYGAAETAGVEITHAAVVSEGLRRGMRYSIGAEVDNDPRSRPDAQNIVDAMKPDGLVRSVHFLPIAHPEHGEGWLWPFDNPEFSALFDVVGVERTWEIYIETLLASLDSQPAQILGHFYVPAKFGHWPEREKLEAYEDRIVEVCREREIAIELNSRAFYRNQDEEQHRRYREANGRLLKKAKAAGVLIAVGSDAHSPRDQGRAFEIVLEMLDEAEINELAFPIGGRFARVALRASKELLEQRRAVAPVAVGSSISGLGRAELAARGVALPPENEVADRSESAARAKLKRAAAAAEAALEAPPKAPRRVKAPAVESSEPAAEQESGAVAAQGSPGEAAAPAQAPAKKAKTRARSKPAAEPSPAAEPLATGASAAEQAGAVAVAAAPAESAPTEAPVLEVPEAALAPAPAPASAKKARAAKPPAAKAAVKRTVEKAPAAKTAAAKPAVTKPAAAKPAAAKPAAAKAAVKKTPAKAAPARAAAKAKAKPVARVAAASAKKPSAPKRAAAAKAPAKAGARVQKPAAKAAKPALKTAPKPAAKAPAKAAPKVAVKNVKAKPKGKTSSSKATRKRR
jgi:HisJ family histidinol phosphate phosphatase